MTPYEFFSPKNSSDLGEITTKKLPVKIKNCCCKDKDAAADDYGSFAYELPKLLGFGK
jgi:hypothetical protein